MVTANILSSGDTVTCGSASSSYANSNLTRITFNGVSATATQLLFDTSVFGIFTIANFTSSIINGQPVGSFVEICLSGDRGGCTSDEDAPAILVAIDSPEDFEKVASSDMLVAAVAEAVTEPVPDPASWAMVIAGFGLTGAAMRRRRTLAVT